MGFAVIQFLRLARNNNVAHTMIVSVVVLALVGCTEEPEVHETVEAEDELSIAALLENKSSPPRLEDLYAIADDKPAPNVVVAWLRSRARSLRIGVSWQREAEDGTVLICRKCIDTDTAKKNFASARWVRVLSCEETGSLSYLASIPSLVGLCFTECRLTAGDLENLARIRGLRWLAFQGGRIDKPSKTGEVVIPELRVMVLQSQEIGDSFLRSINSGGKVKTLSIAGTRVSDEALTSFITQNPSIQYLDIHSCPLVTSSSVSSIVKLKDLRYLSIVDSAITFEDGRLKPDLIRLREALPQCYVQVFD